VLSNSWANPYPRHRWGETFDVVVISGEVGMRKPEERIFHHVLGRLEVEARDAVFVDDEEPNLVVARSLGMRAINAVDQAQAEREITLLLEERTGSGQNSTG
jgi:HAD superfamily hydrolase (TIGR01509 family)